MGAVRVRRDSSPSLSLRQKQQLVVSLLVVTCFAGLCLLGIVGRIPFSVKTNDLNLENGVINEKVNLAAATFSKATHRTNNINGGNGVRKEKVYLAAVIFNRVFPQDLFKITAYECKQWIEYMLFAGVQHVYWYDTAHSDGESQKAYLQEYVEKGLLTYHRFHHMYPGHLNSGYNFEQDHSYGHFLQNYGRELPWVVEMDVDEYPFMLADTNKLFLRRYVEYFAETRPDVSQVLMPCMIFGGNPKGDLENGWVIERYQRRMRFTEGEAGSTPRTKPIFQPKNVTGVGVHDPHLFPMASGRTVSVDPAKLRMNHYWGPRLSDFGPDTATVLAQLVPDSSAQPIATELKASTGLTDKKACLQDRRPS